MENQVFIQQVNVSFNLRQTKVNEPTLLYLVYRLDGKQSKISTGVKVYPKHWDKRQQIAMTNRKLSSLDIQNNIIVNETIDEYLRRFADWKEYLLNNPKELYRKERILKQFMNMEKESDNNNPIEWFLGWVNNYCSAGERTKEKYKSEIKYFNNYLINATSVILSSFTQITYDLMKDYEQFLIGKNLDIVTINDKVRVLILLLNRAEEFSLLDLKNNGLSKWKYLKNKGKGDDNNKVYLTEDEIERIYNLPLVDTKMVIRDMFVLQYLLGQRISDIQNIGNAVFNQNSLTLIQIKTKKKVTLPITKRVKEILEKYEYQCPTIYHATNVTRYIKKIAQEAGVEGQIQYLDNKVNDAKVITKNRYELVSSHTARHSFVTNELLKGTSIDMVRKISGHSSKEILDIYNHVNSEDATKFILKREADENVEKKQSKEVSKPFATKIKEKVKVLDYLFAETSLLRLNELQANGINIYDLAETTKAITIIKDIKQTDKVKEFLASIDKSILFGRVDKLDSIIWNIARYYFDFTLYQVFQQKVIELGLSERITEVIDADDLNELWHQEYVLKELEKEQPD